MTRTLWRTLLLLILVTAPLLVGAAPVGDEDGEGSSPPINVFYVQQVGEGRWKTRCSRR